MKGWKGFVAAVALVAGLASATPARAGSWEDAGWGSLTMLSNCVYMPAKLVYATVGGLTGGLALGLTGGDMETAEKVWVTSMGGTWVLTPGMLQGQDAIAFAGTPAAPNTASATADTHGAEDNTTANTHTVEEQQLGGS
jgi:hypothetical protein